MSKIVNFYIDGFNLYHSLKSYHKDHRWLNLKSLCEKFLKNDEKLGKIYFFTAHTTWKPEKLAKQKEYLGLLKTDNIEIILGKFKKKFYKCNNCNIKYPSHEEKMTDINIALTIFEDSYLDEFDNAWILSGDTDLVSTIKKIKGIFLNKDINVLFPKGRPVQELKDVADFHIKIKEIHLKTSLYPRIVNVNGKSFIAPEGWTPNNN